MAVTSEKPRIELLSLVPTPPAPFRLAQVAAVGLLGLSIALTCALVARAGEATLPSAA